MVSFGIAVQAGGYDEQRDQLGVSDFVASMLRRGTKTRSADDISNAIDFVGGSLDAQASNEATNAGCSSLSKDAKLCLDLLSDILLHPSFPESEMGEVRDEMLAAIAARFDNPHALANAHFENLLFGEKHPDGWILAAEDVRKITRDEPGRVLEDVLPPEPRHPRRRGRRRRGEAARRHREGVRRLGAWQGAGARRPGPSRRSRRRASCWSIGPTRRRRRWCSAIKGSSTRIRAGTPRR